MPELSNIQTYIQLNGNDFEPTIHKFAEVLKRIGIWNEEVKSNFDALEWKVEDNGFVHFSGTDMGFYQTNFSDVKVRPLIMVWTPAIDHIFHSYWISCDLLIETEAIRDLKTGHYKEGIMELVKKLVKELAIQFDETGVYFTNEAQDGEDFDGIRMADKSKLWKFDYALIPQIMKVLYGVKPKNFKVIESGNWIECWNLNEWMEK